MKSNLLLLAALALTTSAVAQIPDTLRPLRVYLELDTRGLNDDNFFRTEVPWVSYVRSRQDADLQVQTTPEPTVADGERMGVYFFGNQSFAAQNDTVWYYLLPGENHGSRREKLLRAYKQGLLGYLLRTPWADYVEYAPQPLRFAPLPASDDLWGQWVCRAQLAGSGSVGRYGSYYRPDNFSTPVRAGSSNVAGESRLETWCVTPQWRVQAGASGRYYRIQPGLSAAAYQQTTWYTGEASAAYSLRPRWSVGAVANYFWRETLNRTTVVPSQENTWGARVGGGLEYSLLPYGNFFRRRLLVGYYLYLNDNAAVRSSQLVRAVSQEWHVSGAVVQRWGFVNATVWADHQPRQQVWDTYLLGTQASAGLRLWRNLFLTADATFTFSNGRYDTSLDDTSGAPLLSSQKARYYNWEMRAGVAYFFGSNKINVVNPRMSAPALTYF